MFLTHVHLVVCHLPIFGTLLAIPLLVLAWIKRTEPSALIGATIVLALAALGAVVAIGTGDPAEELVKGIPGVLRAAIEEHEERAQLAAALTILDAVAAMATSMFLFRRPAPRLAIPGLLAGTVVAAAAMAWAGAAGGEIRHTELSVDATVAERGEADR